MVRRRRPSNTGKYIAAGVLAGGIALLMMRSPRGRQLLRTALDAILAARAGHLGLGAEYDHDEDIDPPRRRSRFFAG